MKSRKLYFLVIACAFLAGCVKSSRSISHSSYREGTAYGRYQPADPGSDVAFAYKCELSEYDILGITRGGTTSEAGSRRPLDHANHVHLRPSKSLLLIPSGATFPYLGPLSK